MPPAYSRGKYTSVVAALLVSAAVIAPFAGHVPGATAQQVQKAHYAFDIRARSLAAGIAEIGAVSGWRIAYTVALPVLEQERIIRGEMSVPQALEQLLRGTDLTFRQTGEATILLAAATGAEGATTLAPIRVEGAGGAAAALPPAYAGGQVATGGQLGLLGNVDIMDAPVSVTSYTSDKIEDQQAQTIAEVLRNDPSVRTLSSSGGMLDSYSIRGFAMNIGNSGEVAFNGAYGIAPNYRALAGFAERIEVLKGPAALLNGMSPNSGVGGVINIVPKRAGDTDLNRVGVDYGLGEQAGAKADISRRFGPDKEFGVRFNGDYMDGDTPLDNQSRTASLGALALDYRGDNLRASLDLIDQREDLSAPSREFLVASGIDMPSAPDGARNVVHKWEWSEAVDQSAVLRGEYDLSDNLTAFGSFGGGKTEVDRLFGYPMIVNSVGGTQDSVSYMRFQTDRWSADAGLRGQFDTGAVSHRMTLQASHYADVFKRGAVFDSTVLSSNIYAPVANPAVAVSAPGTKPKLSESALSGLALADTLSMFEDQLMLTLGARYQTVQSDNFSAASGAVTSSYDETELTPMVGIVVKPWENVSLYANYIEGLSKGDIAPNTAINAGQAMKPYVAEQYEAGVKLDFGKVGTTVSLFQITKPFGQVEGGVYSSGGEQRNRGIEVSVFGEITPEIRLLGGVMLLDAELTETNSAATRGNTPVGVADFQANLTAEWDTPFLRGLTLSGSVIHTGSQFVDTANTQEIPSWTTFDLGVRYKTVLADTPVTLRATVQNLFDEGYWASVNSYSMVALGAPRTALFSITADF
ncbi:MAG: TonB-dependent receptor [Alphaproteobacteria bacterium]|nr:TonB-dependent receptor [Alphaproteobacteria bacterium]MBU0796992.1 TonB-dependent receptor [Alphaproteobacteria bacterium]MBU0886801.1 TonB-dependent receptor [Alphaproteobacteria bacterium]MBU1812457.1 TonB-dependent receptor [Alphaproteobacteria bacterium]